MNMIKIELLPEFHKDLKTLIKKYRTIEEDIAILEKVNTVTPSSTPPFNYDINNLGIATCVIKVRKLPVNHLRGVVL